MFEMWLRFSGNLKKTISEVNWSGGEGDFVMSESRYS